MKDLQKEKAYKRGIAEPKSYITPQGQLAVIGDSITALFDAVEGLASKLEPVLFPMDASDSKQFSEKGEVNSAIVTDLVWVNQRLLSLNDKISTLKSYIQL